MMNKSYKKAHWLKLPKNIKMELLITYAVVPILAKNQINYYIIIFSIVKQSDLKITFKGNMILMLLIHYRRL